jgi:transglutaminase-like putative cysteine protease
MVASEIVQRTRVPFAGILFPLASFVGALFFGIGGGGSRNLLALLMALIILVFAGMTARPPIDSTTTGRSTVRGRSTAAERRIVEAGVVGTCALVLAIILGGSVPLVASGRPYNPRANEVPPAEPMQAINPLDQLAVWASHPAKPVMTIRSAYPGPWRLAVLPTWNPVDGWTTSDASTFYRIGTDVPGPTLAPTQISPGDTAATQEIHIQDLPGPWLPAAQRPVTITGVQALAQPSTSELLAASGRATGSEYSILSSVPAATPNGASDGPGSYPLIAGIPPNIQSLAVQMTQGAVTPWEKATALVGALGGKGSKYQFLASAPSGTNTQVLQNFLVGTGPSAHKGTSEQFAGAFALLAEALNLPTRVVVEFHSGTEVDGEWHVTTKDAFAAAEVEFANLGWVLFDSTPRPDSAPAPKDETVKGSSTISASTPPVPSGKHYTQGTPPPKKAQSGNSTVVHVLIVVGVVVGVILLILAILALLVSSTRKRRTRKRRSAEVARDRVLGAWLESLELVRDLGPPPPSSDTASQLATVGAQRLGVSEELDFQPLAKMANATLFSTWEPDDDAALEAWQHTDRVAEQIGDQLSVKGRFLRAFDIRVLFR